MIEMNLMDSPSYIIGNYSSGNEKKGAGIFLLIIIIVLVPLFSLFLAKHILDAAKDKEAKGMDIERKEIARTKVESVVEEIIDSAATVMEIPVAVKDYESMAKLEQMNYEVKFNLLALEEFSKIVPDGITFTEIRVFGYKTILAEGTAPNKNSLAKLLNELKKDDWKLYPKPQTNIRDGGSFYYFHIEADFIPSPADLTQNPINPENNPTLSRLGKVKDKIVGSAKTAQIKTGGLNLEVSVNEPNEKKYTYSINFEGDYQNVLKFIKSVSVMKEPIRNESITVKNNSKTKEHITVKNGAKSVEGTAMFVITLQ